MRKASPPVLLNWPEQFARIMARRKMLCCRTEVRNFALLRPVRPIWQQY